jgi:hypothetical protein
MNPTPRAPTAHELVAIAYAISEHTGEIFLEAMENVRHANPVVFDHYMTDSPGYIGRVAVVLWNGGPGMVTTFTFRSSARDASAVVAGGLNCGRGLSV